MPEKLDKSQVIGLPEGAALQFIKDKWYVFFAYCYRLGENLNFSRAIRSNAKMARERAIA